MAQLITIDGRQIDFIQIDFTGHEKHYVNTRPDSRVGNYGYRMMCRFFCGPMQEILTERYGQFAKYMRLDDDAYIVAPISEVMNAQAATSDYLYVGWADDPYQDLWKFTVEFMISYNLTIPNFPSGGVIYNNFHVSSLALWNHHIVKKFLDKIDGLHAYTKLGWNDAQVHTVLAMMLGPALGFKTRQTNLFHYRHNQHCCHPSIEHTTYCDDGKPGQFHWGPPACLKYRSYR